MAEITLYHPHSELLRLLLILVLLTLFPTYNLFFGLHLTLLIQLLYQHPALVFQFSNV